MTAPDELWKLADLVTPMAIRTAATLRLADHLADGATTVDELAERTGCDVDALGRLLRHLAAAGLLRRTSAGEYASTPLGERLRSDDLSGTRDWLDINGAIGRGDLCFVDLLETVRTGEPAYPRRYGKGFWADLADDPALAASFDTVMSARATDSAPAIANGYDWASVGHVVDVGGGDGTLLVVILSAHPKLRGTVLDLPGAASLAERKLAAAGLAERCQVVAGSFFDPLPAGADVYLLSRVIHDWDDAGARAILRRCAEAAGAGGVVLLAETPIDDSDPEAGTEVDLRMLTYFAGRERTVEQLRALGVDAGLTPGAVTEVAEYVTFLEFTVDS